MVLGADINAQTCRPLELMTNERDVGQLPPLPEIGFFGTDLVCQCSNL